MSATLSFLGAARNVTGSCYLLEVANTRILIDCGLVQERALADRNWAPFPVPPASIDALLLTHAHLDHCGLIPKLVKEGFRGRIISTPASLDIAEIVMRDSGKIQEEDAAFKLKRHIREGRTGPHPVRPLYTLEDAERVSSHFSPVEFEEEIEVAEGITASWHTAGHILGAASIRLSIPVNGHRRTLLFSGDIGRDHAPILKDPVRFEQADYVVMESTYANRDHPIEDVVEEELARVVNETVERGGNLVIPSFAVERSQDLLYHLGALRKSKRIPKLMVFVDSPMAIGVTEVFRRHPDLFDENTRERIRNGEHPCDFPGLILSRTRAQSQAINQIRGTAIIIAGSGMCTGGRIKHHLGANLPRPESTILFVGFQARGTLGRLILDGKNPVRILGVEREVHARIERINGFSGHAGRSELIEWFDAIKTPPRHVFATHGEEQNAIGWAEFLRSERGIKASAPEYLEKFILD